MTVTFQSNALGSAYSYTLDFPTQIDLIVTVATNGGNTITGNTTIQLLCSVVNADTTLGPIFGVVHTPPQALQVQTDMGSTS
jgi:hypothetical protein